MVYVRSQALALQKHQDIPFERIVEMIRPERSLAYSPVFQIVFSWQNAPKGTIDLPGLQISSLPVAPHAVSKFDLTLWLGEAGNRIVGGLEYATSLFEAGTIERYLGYFRRLLEGMVADAERPISELPLLSEAERRLLLEEWNETASDYPKEKRINQLFEEQVERTPEAVAVVYEEQQLTYRELNKRANRLAHHLQELGVKPDKRVALCVERGVEMIMSLLGVLKAGGAYVPLDPIYPAERLRYMVEDCRPTVLLTQGHLEELFSGLSPTVTALNLAEATSPWNNQPETNPDHTYVGLTPEHLAYVIYTSGSTALPRVSWSRIVMP